MTPDEVESLQDAGRAFLFNISIVVTQSILYGLYLAIFTFGIRALLKRNSWNKYTWTLFGFLSILCLIVTAYLATTVAFTIELIRGFLISNPEMSLDDRFQAADDLTSGLGYAQNWLGGNAGGGFLFVFADAVVVWRACVLWPGSKAVRVSLLALLLTSLASAIVASTLQTITLTAGTTIESDVSATGVLLTLSQSLSLATNIVATTVIGYKAYYHRLTIKNTIGMQSSKSAPILLFLTESGMAFCILQLIALITTVTDDGPLTSRDYAGDIWSQITIFAAASYPVLILLIIESHRSISDSTRGSAGDSGVAQDPNSIGSHLSFAVRPPGGTSSSGGGVGVESLIGSRVDPTGSIDNSHEESIRVRDLEKGERLTSGAALTT